MTNQFNLDLDCYLLAHSDRKQYLFDALSALIKTVNSKAGEFMEYDLTRFYFLEGHDKKIISKIIYDIIETKRIPVPIEVTIISEMASYRSIEGEDYFVRKHLCKAIRIVSYY